MHVFDVEPAGEQDAAAVLALRRSLEEWLAGKGVEQWGRGEVGLREVGGQIAADEWHVVRSPSGGLRAALRLLWSDEQVWRESNGRAAYVHGLMVDRLEAGRGLGAALLAWAEQRARDRGAPALRLDCVESNQALRSYYRALGFAEVGRRDFDGPWLSAVLWEKVLEPAAGVARTSTGEQDADPLDGVLIGGREQVPIVVVDPDPEWPDRYELVRARVLAALGPAALRVEHIGSTSVPGLAAKPIIDVLVTVQDVEDEAAYVPLLERAGFVLRVREPGHRMVRTPARDIHVHLYEPDHEAVGAYLDLRDWLRVAADDRALYARTKRRLATRTWTDMDEYADAKTDVITAILGRARTWRAAQGSATT